MSPPASRPRTACSSTLRPTARRSPSFEDTTDAFTSGVAGVYMDFDEQIPLEERTQTVFVFDNFEVLTYE